jgi:TfoX/Sxy family transcriptional regulator of competence genes
VLEQLASLDVTARARFGDLHLYLGDSFFGLIAGGRIYFRTDDESRAECVDRGMEPLQPADRPRGPRTVDRHFEVPARA